MPEAWLMLETLEKFGYTNELKTARERLYTVLVNDSSMHELFNSETGEGLGSAEQGWTCAVFLKLSSIINKE